MIGAVNRPLARRLACPLTAAVLLAGCASTRPAATVAAPTASAPTASAPAASAPATCPPSGARLELGETDAAMGLRALGIHLINCGREPYRVNGYPVVHALDEHRSTLTVRVLHGVTEIAGPLDGWTGPPRPVVLKPGERAAAVMVWRNTYDDISRPPVDAPYLAVAAAAGRPAQVLVPEGGIDLGSTGRLGISPWRPSPAPQPAPPPATATASQDAADPLV
jgi:hypothetical protein